jgi:hypothetical protein
VLFSWRLSARESNLIANHRSTRRPATKARRQPQLELLETRDLLSGFTTDHVLLHAGATPMGTTGPTGYTPSQVRHAYGFDQISFNGVAGDGRGTTIALVDAYDDPNVASDLHQFDLQFGLHDPPSFQKVSQTGSTTALPAADGGWAGEIALDVEWAHAIAPGANILLVEANDSSYTNLFAAVDYAARQPGVAVVSMSWGGGESSSETSWDSHFVTPSGHTPVAFVAASGDSGAPVSYPAVSPNVLSVGGTSLYLTSTGAYSSESGWSGSGGGVSSVEAQPSYQKGVVTQSSTYRTNPDVSYDADPNTGFAVYDSYNNGSSAPWSQYGGTSIAAPQWASLVAIADQGRAAAGKAVFGSAQLLPAIYQLPASDFHDVTTGTSTGSPNESAGPGYDLVTGRGSPVANLVVADLVGPTSAPTAPAVARFQVTVSSPSTTAGSAVSITVTALDASNNPISGYLGTVHFTSTDGSASLPANYTFTTADAGTHTFSGVILRTAGSETVTVVDTAATSATGSVTILVSQAAPTSTVIENFENGLGQYWAVGSDYPAFYDDTAAAHDGTHGLENPGNGDWIYRNDSAAQVKQGDTFSVWVQLYGAANGRAYFGFGSSANGTLSLVAAPNTNQLLLQSNVGYGFTNLAAVSQSYQVNHWYRLEVDWGTSGAIVGRLFDSDGKTLLNTVTASTTAITSGGIAFRATGYDTFWDTVTVTHGVNTFQAGQPAAGGKAMASVPSWFQGVVASLETSARAVQFMPASPSVQSPAPASLRAADLFFALARGRTGSLSLTHGGDEGAALGSSKEWLL